MISVGASGAVNDPRALATSRILLAATTFCIFSVKIILIPFGESGVRADDFVILAMAVYFMLVRPSLVLYLPSSVKIYAVFIAWQLLSALYNGVQGRVAYTLSSVFVLRLVEYLCFLLVGMVLSGEARRLFGGIVVVYSAYLVVLVLGQRVGIIPTFSEFDNARASGNANGPYELAVIGSFLFLYHVSLGNIVWVGVSLALVIATSSRITIFADAVVILNLILRRRGGVRMHQRAGLVFLALLACGVLLWSASQEESFASRISQIEGGGWLADFSQLYTAAATYTNHTDYFDGIFDKSRELSAALGGDDSGNIRLIRWATLIKSSFQQIDSQLIGLGPSFGSAAVDGYFVRVLVESGLVGLALFIIFLVNAFREVRNNTFLSMYLFVMAVTGIFIDIFVSYKPMLLFWLWYGMSYTESRVRVV